MTFAGPAHSGGIIYPLPIPEGRYRDLIYVYNSRFDCPQMSDRDLTKGTSVGSYTDGTGPAPGPLANFGDYSHSNIYYPMCCYTVNTTVYDWGTGSKSFIFTNIMIREFNAGGINCIWMRRGDGTTGWGISWEIYTQTGGSISVSGDGVTTCSLSLDLEINKYYQLGIVLDRPNNKIWAAATEYNTRKRTEVIKDLPANWVGHNFTTIGDDYGRASAGGYAANASTSTNRKTINGVMGHFYLYSNTLNMKEI